MLASLGEILRKQHYQPIQPVKIRDLSMRTQYIAINNLNEPDILKDLNSSPEASPGRPPVVALWGDVSGEWFKPHSKLILAAAAHLISGGVDEAIISLEPQQPHSRLYLRLRKADGHIEALFDLYFLFSEQ